jgi:hypothetical protein
MSPIALRNTDVVGGFLTVGLAVGVLVESSEYERGTLLRMGPGYFPMLLGTLLLTLGVVLTLRGFMRHGEPLVVPPWHPVVFISAAVGLFAFTLPAFGLLPAIMLLVVVSACASPVRRPKTIALLAVGMAAFAYVVFVRLLSLHIDFVRW